MKHNRSDIILLSIVIFLLGASAFFLQWRMVKNRKREQLPTTRFSYVGDLKLSAELQSLLYTRSITAIVDTFKKYDPDTMCTMARAVVHNAECPLSNEERFSFLLALASSVSYNRALQDRIFTIFADYYKKRGIEPLLLLIANSEYASLMPEFVAWVERANPVQITTLIRDAFKNAIDRADVAALESLYMRGVRLTPEQSTDYVWYIVQTNKSADLIPFFAKWGKANLNDVGPHGKSLVVQAAAHNNKPMMRMLIAEGAHVGHRGYISV